MIGHGGDFYPCKSAAHEKTAALETSARSVVEHVKTVLRLNVPMAAFNKLGKIRGMCLRVESLISFFQGSIFIKLVQQSAL